MGGMRVQCLLPCIPGKGPSLEGEGGLDINRTAVLVKSARGGDTAWLWTSVGRAPSPALQSMVVVTITHQLDGAGQGLNASLDCILPKAEFIRIHPQG